MKYTIKFTKEHKKNYNLMKKRGLDIGLLDDVVGALAEGAVLEPKYKDHTLKGNKKDFRECHIKPNWLLIYRKDDDVLVLTCVQTGTHSDLLGY